MVDALQYTPQEVLHGTQGQVVGFDEDGNAVAQEMGVVYVHLTKKENASGMYTHTADMTSVEIAAAHDAGRTVYCLLNDRMLPLIRIDREVHESGTVLYCYAVFGLHSGAFFDDVSVTKDGDTSVYTFTGVLHEGDGIVVFPPVQDNIGKLFYVDSSGNLMPLALDSALKIEDGKLKAQHLYMQYGMPKIVPLGEITLVDTVDSVTKYALRVTNGNLTIAEVK